VSSGIGAFVGGLIVTQNSSGAIEGFGIVGLIAAASTFISLFVAARVKILDAPQPTAEEISLAAAAEASADAGEPILSSELGA
jgi:hypothetical protein